MSYLRVKVSRETGAEKPTLGRGLAVLPTALRPGQVGPGQVLT